MDLAASATALDTGLNRILYTPRFVDSMRPKALAMNERFPSLLKVDKIKAARTIHDIDNAVTAVLYGAKDADDYYAKNASKPRLNQIRLSTLILNAKNDPFIPEVSLPTATDVSKFVTLEYPETGGHVGFSGRDNWLSDRLLEFFQAE
jgi:predicted alpha/beta-fold hydrolase